MVSGDACSCAVTEGKQEMGRTKGEREWLSGIVKHLQKTDPTPVALGTLAQPALGVARPDGVKVKLSNLLRKHGMGWGLVLTEMGSKKAVSLKQVQ